MLENIGRYLVELSQGWGEHPLPDLDVYDFSGVWVTRKRCTPREVT